MCAERDDLLIVVLQVREYLLIVVNKEKEIKEFHFFYNQLFSIGVCTRDTFMHCFFGRITCKEYKQKKTKCSIDLAESFIAIEEI